MAKAEGTAGEVMPYDRIELPEILDALTGKGKIRPLDEDPEAATRRIVGRILEGNVDTAFSTQSVIKADDLVNAPLRLMGVEWLSSDYDEGAGFFALANVALLGRTFCGETGDVVKVSMGGTQILAQLYKWAEAGNEPRDIVIRKAEKPTKRGYYPKWLEDAPTTVAA